MEYRILMTLQYSIVHTVPTFSGCWKLCFSERNSLRTFENIWWRVNLFCLFVWKIRNKNKNKINKLFHTDVIFLFFFSRVLGDTLFRVGFPFPWYWASRFVFYKLGVSCCLLEHDVMVNLTFFFCPFPPGAFEKSINRSINQSTNLEFWASMFLFVSC